MRAKVPPRLRDEIGRSEIFVSLKTKDYPTALKRVKIESLNADRIIDAAQAKYRGKPDDIVTTDEELRWMSAASASCPPGR